MSKKSKEPQKINVLDTIKNVSVPQVIDDIKQRITPKKSFRKAHPFLFALATFGQIILTLLPLAVWLALTLWIFPVERSGLLIVGGAGAFLIGVGLLNLTMRCFGRFQYLGCLTVLCLAAGGMLTALASLILYIPEIYARFDESVIPGYIISVFAMLWYTIMYGIVFRGGVQNYLLNRGVSKSRIKKLKKGGLRNYWWYADLHDEIGLGVAYGMNILFTVLLFFASMMNIFFGWIRNFRPVTGGMLTAAGVLCVVMMCWSLAHGRKKESKFFTWLMIFGYTLLTVFVTASVFLIAIGKWF